MDVVVCMRFTWFRPDLQSVIEGQVILWNGVLHLNLYLITQLVFNPCMQHVQGLIELRAGQSIRKPQQERVAKGLASIRCSSK